MKNRFSLYWLKKINIPLTIGIIIITSLVLMVLFPKLFTNKDPYDRRIIGLRYVQENGQRVQKYERPPLAPDKDNPLGTDVLGRDIFTRICYGANITLKAVLLIALLRMAVALPLGIWAGLGGKSPSFLIKNFNIIFSTIPPLVACFVVLNVPYISQLQLDQSIMAFAIVFTVVGWSKLASVIEQNTKEILGEVFIEGEVAIGKSKAAIVTQNVLPHLVPSLSSYFFLEIGMVLFLIAQLSVLDIFVGPRLVYVDLDQVTILAQEPEWGSMLSKGVTSLLLGKWWVVLFPAAAFAYAIIGFNFFGEGLRIEFEKRNSRAISILRRVPNFFSPAIYYKQLRKFKKYPRIIAVKTVCYVIILALIFMPAPKSAYLFEVEGVFEHINELISDKYSGRVLGTSGGYMAAEYIVEQLEKYGIEPFFDEGYFKSFTIVDTAVPMLNRLKSVPVAVRTVKDAYIKTGGSTFWIGTDFLVDSIKAEKQDGTYIIDTKFEPIHIKGNVINFNDIADQTLNPEDYAGSILFVPALSKKGADNDTSVATAFAETCNISTILIDSNKEELRGGVTSLNNNTNIVLTKAMAEHISQNINKEIEIEIEVQNDEYGNNGRTIVGVLRGTHNPTVTGAADDTSKPEYVVIGASYDGVASYNNKIYPLASGISGAGISLQLAKTLSELKDKPRQDIVFIFYDGEQMGYGSRDFRFNPLLNPNRAIVYGIDLGDIGGESQSKLYYSTETPKIYGESTFDFITYFKDRLKALDIKNLHGQAATPRFYSNSRGFSFIISVTSRNFQTYNTSKDTVENLNNGMIKKTGQIVLDTLIWHCYGGK